MNAIGTAPRPRERLTSHAQRRQARRLTARRLAMRRAMLVAAKIGLPLLAALLLALVVLWPEIMRAADHARLSFRRTMALEAESGRMLQPRYKGVDQRNRPYAITGTWANQTGQNRIDIGDPKGDITLENGTWMQVEARDGVFIQHTELLDLSQDVVLYRDDGTTMYTSAATVDIRQGAAGSNEQTHAEGPFGVLDSQGFMMGDKASTIQFQGPARLLMNSAGSK